MVDPVPQESLVEATPRLPVHVPTLARNLWRRRAVPVVFAVCGALLGLALAPAIGSREFRAETVLLFRPLLAGTQDSATVQTQQHLVKVQGNLDETRRRLGWKTSLPALASAVDVAVQKNTELMFIRASAEQPADAAALANTLRQVFLENQSRIRHEDGAKTVADMEARAVEVGTALAKADAALAAFTERNGVADLDRTTGAYLQEAMSIDVLYQQALAEREEVTEKQSGVGRATAELKKRVAKEQKEAGATEDLTSLNIRIGRLRSAIEEDRRNRAGSALLVQKEADLKRAEELRREGLLSKAEFDKVQSDYEWQKALSVDTEQIDSWKAELKRLDTGVIPKNTNETSTSPILRDVMLRALDLDLEKGGVGERVRRLDEARTEMRRKLESLPALQRDYVALKRDVDAREVEKRSVEDLLGKFRAAAGANSSDFTVVSEARIPIYPTTSSKRLVFYVCLASGVLVGILLIVAAELLDRTLRSAGDIAVHLGEPPVLVLPRMPPALTQPLGDQSPRLAEHFRRLAWRLRQDVNGRGVRLLVVAATPGEGTTYVASQLAAALGRLDERVLLFDANVRQRDSGERLESIALSHDPLAGGVLLPSTLEAKFAAFVRTSRARLVAALPEALRARLRVAIIPLSRLGQAGSAAWGWLVSMLAADHVRLASGADLRSLLLPASDASGLADFLSYRGGRPG